MSEGMIERVARAIARAQLDRQYVGRLENIGCFIEIDRIWPEFVPEARRAIKAMREPTEALINRMMEQWDDNPCAPSATAGWKAAIDAALNEKSPASGER
jgi:hypothetical protein